MYINVPTKTSEAQLMSLMKSYQADQQVKFLSLEAEIDILLKHLQNLQAEKLKQHSQDN